MVEKDCVSVIIPVYNRENMISSAINSVLSQSYSNIELLVIDDGSTDNTKNIIKSFTDDRVQLIETSHSGAYVTRNIGIKKSRGEYIAFLDSDDIWLPEKLEKEIMVAKRNGVDFVFTNGFILVEDNNGYEMRLFHKIDEHKYSGKLYAELLRNNFIPTSSVMLHRSIFNNLGYFISESRSALDYEMWLRVAKGYEMAYISQPLLLYKVHTGSIQYNRIAGLQDELYVYGLERKWCAQNGLKTEAGILRYRIAKNYTDSGLIYYSTGKGSLARKYFFKALMSRTLDLYSAICCLVCIVTPYSLSRLGLDYYRNIRLNPKTVLKGGIIHSLLSPLHRLQRLNGK